MLAPICLFTYNRLFETKQTITALQKNYLAIESRLFIFSDGAKDVNDIEKVKAVRQFLNNITGFKTITIFESKTNKGLANSIINGVTQIINEYKKVIVLEDDLITLPNFLNYMNQALSFYENEERIQSICGFSPYLKELKLDFHFQKRSFPWSWATWLKYWDNCIFEKEIIKKLITNNKSILIDFGNSCGNDINKMLIDSLNNNNDSWYVRWAFNQFHNKNYSLYPAKSFVSNIGFSEQGTHCKTINSYTTLMNTCKMEEFIFPSFQIPELYIEKSFLKYFTFSHKLLVRIKLIKSKKGRQLLYLDLRSKILKNN